MPRAYLRFLKFFLHSIEWISYEPTGLRQLLYWMYEHFEVPLYVTENGVMDKGGYLDDMWRVYYYKYYINNVLKGESSSYYPYHVIPCPLLFFFFVF